MFSIAYLVAAAASVALGGTPEGKPVEVSAPSKEKKICRRETATGSIMPRSVCRTKAEWNAITAQSQSDRDRLNDMERSKSLVDASRQ